MYGFMVAAGVVVVAVVFVDVAVVEGVYQSLLLAAVVVEVFVCICREG